MASFENSVVVAKNLNFDLAAPKPHLGVIDAAGKLPIGTGNTFPTPEILGGSLTSPGNTITIGYNSPDITLDVVGGGGGITTINGDTGSITGATVTVFANNAANNSGSSVSFVNSGTVSTLNLTDSNGNTILGQNAGNLTVAGQNNSFYGTAAGQALTSGLANDGFGFGSLAGITSGSNNSAFGNAGGNLTTGSTNTFAGYHSGLNLVSGNRNTLIGTFAGTAYTTSESNNVLLASDGVVGESNTMRLGRTGSGPGQVNKAFVAATTGTTVTGSSPVAVDANGQLSDLGFGTAAQVLTSNGAGVSPTWQAAGGSVTAFYAYLTTQANNVTGDGTVYQVAFDATGFDTAAAFTTGASAHFTAPTTGIYSFSWNVQGTGIVLQTFAILTFNCNFNTSGTTFKLPTPWTGAGIESYTGSAIVSMTAGDTAFLTLNLGGSTKTVSVTGAALPTVSTFFSGIKVG